MDTTSTSLESPTPCVRHFRQALLWPLRLMPVRGSEGKHPKPWQVLADMGDATPWREVVDEYTGDANGRFQERHYNEFVTFLPYVQRFLYGEGSIGNAGAISSPMRVFRRSDVSAVRAVTRPGEPAVMLRVEHVDLYFFLDLDLVLLNLELSADELDLPLAQELMYRVGRGYPAGWDAQGNALHCLFSAEWLGTDGQVLARSDANEREAFMSHVSTYRAPRISAHWAWLLQPLVSDHTEQSGPLRFRQIEYYRMPQMAYLALDKPQELSRNDFVRLGLVTGATTGSTDGNLPYAENHLSDFEQRFCYDRFWSRLCENSMNLARCLL